MGCSFSNAGSPVEGCEYVSRLKFDYKRLLHCAKAINPTPSFVHGLPGVGKSSLANRLRLDLKNSDMDCLVLNQEQVPRTAEASHALVASIIAHLVAKCNLDSSLYGGDIVELKQALFAAKGRHYSCVIIIDQFCRHFKTDYRDDFYDKVVALFSITSESDYSGVVHFAVFSRRSLEMIHRRTGASFLAGRCEPYHLQPFNLDEMRMLCKLSNRAVDAEQVFNYTGGVPLLGALLLREVNFGECTLKDAREKIRKMFDDYYSSICRFFKEFFSEDDELSSDLRERGVLNGLDCLVWRENYNFELPAEVEDEIVGYGFGHEHFPPQFKSLLLYINASRKDKTPLLLKLAKLETDLRRLIDRELSAYYGTEKWFEEKLVISDEENWTPIRKGKKTDIKETLIRWRDEAIAANPDASVNLLDYTYPDDLWGLIRSVSRHWKADEALGWKGLKSCFNDDETKFDQAMRAFGSIRNFAHHCRKTPRVIEEEFSSVFGFLRNCLDQQFENDSKWLG